MRILKLFDREKADYEIEEHGAVYTAQDLAIVTRTKGGHVLKPVVVRSGGRHVMCVIPADHRLDLDGVAKALGMTAPAELVTEEELAGLFPDADVGAECPVGELYGMETLMEGSLHDSPHDVVFQCGSHRLAVRMAVTEFVRIVNPTLASISHHV